MISIKLCFLIILLYTFEVCHARLYGIPEARLNLPSSNEESYKNLRVKRQTLGYPRDTDIVVVSPGSNQAYRGIPTNGARGQTVVVRVPNENYGRRYIATSIREPRMNH